MKRARRFRISEFGFRIALVTVLLAAGVNQSWGYVISNILSSAGVITAQKWASMPITWQMNPTVGANVTGTRELAELLRESFAAWQAVGTAQISFTEGPAANAGSAFDGINIVTSNLSPAEFGS